MRDIFNNIVLIDTYNSLGSGVILPCRYDIEDDKEDNKKDNEKNVKDFDYYIILTNYHVVHNKENITEPFNQLECKDIHLTIFDKYNEIIPDEDYQIVKIETVFPSSEEEDIAAILLKIRKSFEINVHCQMGRQKELDEGDRLYTKGFPGILQEEAEAMAVRFAGILQLNRYKNGKMGTYRMEENIHYYADYSDETVFAGLSGGPVFIEKEEGIQLIGINQGVFADNYGDSPYQLVRFISLSYVLEYLRQNGCILYSLLYGKISIIWIKEDKKADNVNREKKKEALCVLGGSGAGKSSFVESLTQNAGILGTVGDGQTTRTDIYYYLSLYTDKPTVKVFFLEDDEFAEKMYHAVFPDLLALIFTYKFDFRKIDIRVEPHMFLRDNLEYLKAIMEKFGLISEQKETAGFLSEKSKFQEKYDCIYSICVNTQENEDEEEIYKSYINFCNILFYCMRELQISRQTIKRIFDTKTREKIIKSLISLNEQSRDTLLYQIDDINFEEFYKELMKCPITTTELAKNIRMLPYELKKMYVDTVYEDNVRGQWEEREKENEEYVKELKQILMEQKGIFSYREISYLFPDASKDSIENYEALLNADFLKDIEKIFINYNENQNNEVESFYKKLHNDVMTKIKSNKETLKNGISLLDISPKDRESLNLCVRSIHTKSLSAFVKYIEVRDSYYYEYAVPVYESGRNEMLLIDTCGLDHIDKGKGNRFTLSERVKQIKKKLEEKDKLKYELNNLIYVKKLDAGRPTEISDIFAYIADMDIEGGLYCVFTGLDIYEKSNRSFFARNKNWHIDSSLEGYPKIVQYLADEQNRDELLRMCNCVAYRKEDLYRVMSKNIITYCANRELNEKQGKYQENNVIGIRYLFESVYQKEIELLQMPIAANEKEQGLEQLTQKEKEIKEELKKLLITMFDMASVIKWGNYYWQTLKANLDRYTKGEKGFARSYDHTWTHLFMEGYRIAFEQEYAEDFYELFNENKKRVYMLVRQMKAAFVQKIIDKKDFLFTMYEECSSKGVDIINPYVIEQVKNAYSSDTLKPTTADYAYVLKKITNFGLLIRETSKEKGIDKLAECFLVMLKSQYENTANAENNFFQVRADVRNKADELIKIISSYGFEKDAIKALLCQRVSER